MSPAVPPLAFFCVVVLAHFPDHLHHFHHRRVPASPALLDALPDTRDPCLWATLAQLVHPLPSHRHDHDLPLSHPDLLLLQRIPDSPNFSLVTLLSLPNCAQLRDDDIANLRALHRLIALDLRGCSISSYALTALARGLSASSDNRAGTWALRLLSLHGCPNIDDDALSALLEFPLLSAVDLRFTRCTPVAVNAHLSSLGFCPSGNSSLFHPAPPSLALCTLEKAALTASVPISLYSCPPQSVFRVHIEDLGCLPPRPKNAAPTNSSNMSQTAIRTTSSAEGTVVFVPPLQKPAKKELLCVPNPCVPAATPPSLLANRLTCCDFDSNVSSFYKDAPARNRRSKTSILPLSAQAVQPAERGKLDPLAVARSPPPWKILDDYSPHAPPNPHAIATCYQGTSDNTQDSLRKRLATRWSCQVLDNPLKVDHARLHKRGSDTMLDMVRHLASKRPKIESEFAPARTRATTVAKSRNPFVRNARSMFAEDGAKTPNEPPASAHEFSREAEPDEQLHVCRSLLPETVRSQGTGVERKSKALKPITMFKPPILPRELLQCSPRRASRPERKLKQTRLSFSREDEEASALTCSTTSWLL